jgi:sugar phosphate isomerase/epimerase
VTIKTCFCTIGCQKNKWGKDRVIERPLDGIIPLIAAAGYDGVEIWEPHLAGLDDAGLDRLRDRLDADGLRVAMISPYFNFTSSAEHAANSVRQGLQVLEAARRLRARAIRCFTGKTASRDATDEQWQWAAASLQTLADASAPDGILWALETHSWNLMDSVEGTERLLKLTDRPNVRIILQPSTFQDDYLPACRALAAHACHVHGADYCAETIDWKQVIALLKQTGFDGYIAVEWMKDDPDTALTREAACLRRLLAR